MLRLASLYFLIFGIISIAGGIAGYVAKASMPSLIAGGGAGLLLIVAMLLMKANTMGGLLLGLLVSLALAGRFVPAFIRDLTGNPQVFMAPLSVIGVVIAILALLKR